MKRCTILVLYDKDGIFDEYVFFLIKELRSVSHHIIAVVNGIIKEEYLTKVEKTCDEIVIRENIGFDAGAYKDIMLNHFNDEDLLQYDELIFCNDSFFGPFVPFKEIFAEMDERECDFWGLNFIDFKLFANIQSYFLVFKNKIMKSKTLFDFFKQMPNVNTFHEACTYFENSIFEYIVDMKFTHSTFCPPNNIDIYMNSDKILIDYNFPILKKKCFSSLCYDKNTILNSLTYINSNFKYDLSLITEYINRKYKIDLNIGFIESYRIDSEKLLQVEILKGTKCENEEIIDFIDGYDNIYLYGTGMYTVSFMHKFRKYKHKIKGMIVSNGYKKEDTCMGYEIIEYEKFLDKNKGCKYGIIVTPRKYKELGITEIVGNNKNILYLW